MKVDEAILTAWLAEQGYSITDFDGDGTLWGYTSKRNHTVGLWSGLLSRQRTPTLLHECWHVRLGHDGHQSMRFENQIDEEVALTLIDPRAYALAEIEYGANTGTLAAALELPCWVIDAYRRVLERRLAA
jgi:hypothetical protein